jgi:hypothetical protein
LIDCYRTEIIYTGSPFSHLRYIQNFLFVWSWICKLIQHIVDHMNNDDDYLETHVSFIHSILEDST